MYLLLCLASIFLMASGGLNVGLACSHPSLKAVALILGASFIALGLAGMVLSFYFQIKSEESDIETAKAVDLLFSETEKIGG